MENVPTPEEHQEQIERDIELDGEVDGEELQRPPEEGSDARLDPEVKARILAGDEPPAEPFSEN